MIGPVLAQEAMPRQPVPGEQSPPTPPLELWTKSFGNWLKSGSEPRPLWRRDPELNLFAGICKKPPTGCDQKAGHSYQFRSEIVRELAEIRIGTETALAA